MKLDTKENAAVAAAANAALKAAAQPERPPLTMYTANLYSQQEVFDFIVSRMIEQGVPAVYGHECVLLDERGNRCALGMLVPGTEGYRKGAIQFPRTAEMHWDLLIQLRTAHDDSGLAPNFLREFCARAREIACWFGLNPAVAR